MFHFSNIVRTKGDPKLIEGGPSLKRPEDQLARALGWFSIGLGVMDLFAPRRVTETPWSAPSASGKFLPGS